MQNNVQILGQRDATRPVKLEFRSARVGPAIVNSGSSGAYIVSSAYDGNSYEIIGEIESTVTAVPGDEDVEGNWIFRTSPGSGGALVVALTLDATQDATVGGDLTVSGGNIAGAVDIGDDTNDTLFAADGYQTMAGTAIVSKDINFTIQTVKLGGVNDPNTVLLDDFNLVIAFDGAAEEEVFAQVHVPHDYMPGTDLKGHFHWAPSTAGGGAASVTWAIEYTITRPENNEVITAGEANLFVTDVEQNLQYEHLKTGDITIDGTGVAVEDIISMRIFRDPTGALGTDDYAQDAYLLSFDLEYLIDRIGEDSRW